MTLAERIDALTKLGEIVLSSSFNESKLFSAIQDAHIHNPWFTAENCLFSIKSIANQWLTHSTLQHWVDSYPQDLFQPTQSKRVAVIMAGNVPFVGFHDMLSVLISGHIFIGKVSSKDGGLMEEVINLLLQIEPRFQSRIAITNDTLQEFDAVIATGSDSSSRYFEHYFGKYPHIIRKSRYSLAILSENPSKEQLQALSHDVFLYFGLGCRSVTKLLVPTNFNFDKLIEAFEPYSNLTHHHKYANNYDYHRAIYLMNQIEHLDSGFFLIKPDDALASPVGVIFYQKYSSIASAKEYIAANQNQLQCVASDIPEIEGSISLGNTQQPSITDYSDGIDTLDFLLKLA